MYDVVVLDDEPDLAAAIAAQIARTACASECIVTALDDPSELAARVSSGSLPDVLLTDIRFGAEGTGGIDLVEQMLPRGCYTQVIYVTGYPIEYCTEVYRTEHVSFLMKPLDQSALETALTKAFSVFEERKGRPIFVRSNGQAVRVLPETVRYMESVRRKVRIACVDGTVETYASLGDFEKMLPTAFLRCHKSFLVNMDFIERIGQAGVVLSDGTEIPVSQKRRSHVRDRIAAHARMLL